MSLHATRSSLAPALTGLLISLSHMTASPAAAEALQLERKIPLGDVRGRIDHLALDTARNRLFVAELGNNSVAVIDIGEGKLFHRISALSEPQGVGYVESTDTLFVANAGDGSVHLYSGADYTPTGTITLGNDADNIRFDHVKNEMVVGYGSGALAFLTLDGRKRSEIRLAAHPESFQLDPSGASVYVNVPEAHQIAVLNRENARQVATWTVPEAGDNFPMTFDGARQRLLVVFRQPALLAVIDTSDGKVLAKVPTCGDADDVFLDSKRRRIYVSCGEGVLDVLQQEGESYRALGRVPTALGARTSLFVASRDRLFVAVRSSRPESPAIWVFRPVN